MFQTLFKLWFSLYYNHRIVLYYLSVISNFHSLYHFLQIKCLHNFYVMSPFQAVSVKIHQSLWHFISFDLSWSRVIISLWKFIVMCIIFCSIVMLYIIWKYFIIILICIFLQSCKYVCILYNLNIFCVVLLNICEERILKCMKN